MTVSRSLSATSLMPQILKGGAGAIWDAITSLFSSPGSLTDEETAPPASEEFVPESLSTHTPGSSLYDPPFPQTTVDSPASTCQSGPSMGSQRARKQVKQQQRPPRPRNTKPESKRPLPVVKVRDFAYEPKPTIIRGPVDERWVFHSMFTLDAIPGVLQREAKEWEAAHAYLYRTGGNRADPPNTIPKTWGGLSKAEDEEMMRQAQARALESRRLTSPNLGLTPTEPYLGEPYWISSSWKEQDAESLACVDAALRREEERFAAIRHRSLVRRPQNTSSLPASEAPSTSAPTGPAAARPGRQSPPHTLHHRTPSSRSMPLQRTKRKSVECYDQHTEAISSSKDDYTPKRRRRNQMQDDVDRNTDDAGIAETGSRVAVRYALRHRRPASPKASSSSRYKTKEEKGDIVMSLR